MTEDELTGDPSFDDLVAAATNQVEHEQQEAVTREQRATANSRRIADLEAQTRAATPRVGEKARDVARELRGQRKGRVRMLRDSNRVAIITEAHKICPPLARGPRFYVEHRERRAREYSATETARRTFEGWDLGVSYSYIHQGSADLGSSEASRAYLLGTDAIIYVKTRHRSGQPIEVQPETFEMLSAASVPNLSQLNPEDERLIARLEHLLNRQNLALRGLALLTARHRGGAL